MRAGQLDRDVVREVRIVCRAIALGALFLLMPDSSTASGIRTYFVPVLVYHHVKPFLPADDAIERGLTVPPAQFTTEMHYLVQRHYRTVSARTLLQALRGYSRLPHLPVVLTFDDGYADMYTDVYPVLRRLHLTATFFIIVGFVGRPRYLTWRQIRTMAAHGMDIEAHTLTHPDLTTQTPARVNYQVSGSRQQLMKAIHRDVRVLAYPYGAYDNQVLRSTAAAGFWGAFTTRQGWNPSSAHLFTLPRVYVDNDDTLSIFAGRLRADPRVLAEDPS